MKGTLKGKYETGKGSPSASVSVNANVGELTVKASITDVADVTAGAFPSILSLAVEKPGVFAVDYTPEKDVKFRFASAVRVLDRTVDLKYERARRENRTTVAAALAFDAANRMTASYGIEAGDCRVGYVWARGDGVVVEPTYDVGKNAWDLAVTRRLPGGDAVKATYQTAAKTLGVEWNRDSKISGFKISTSFNLAEPKATPKIVMESTWNFEM